MVELRDTLQEVFKEEHDRFIYVSDQVQYKMPDKWIKEEDIPDLPEVFRGDCEDFALACRKNLRRRGIDTSRLVLCLDSRRNYHMILEVEGWVFDCQQRSLMMRDELGYGWIMISGYNPGEPWRSLVYTQKLKDVG